MAYAIGTVVIWLCVISIGIPCALGVLYLCYKARMHLLAGVLLMSFAAAVYFDPVGFLVLCTVIATPFVIGRLRYKAWSLDEQMKIKVNSDRVKKGYDGK